MDNKISHKRLVRSKSGLKIIDMTSRSLFQLCEPDWLPDKKSPDCTNCHTKFDFLRRRHHCRRCGQVYCNACCIQRYPVRRMCFVDPVRLCQTCIPVTERENDFYDKHLKVLVAGANFHLTFGDDVQSEKLVPFFCRLSADHRDIVFDGGSIFCQDPLSLANISAVKLVRTNEFTGENEIGGAKIAHFLPDNEFRDVYLKVAPVPNHRQSALWIVSLRKAVKLLVKDSHFQEDWNLLPNTP